MKRTAKLPSFTSDRMLLLGPLITPRAIDLARARLLDQKARINKTPDDIATKRVALLLLLEMNPLAHRTNEEEAILRGLDPDTIGRMRTGGQI